MLQLPKHAARRVTELLDSCKNSRVKEVRVNKTLLDDTMKAFKMRMFLDPKDCHAPAPTASVGKSAFVGTGTGLSHIPLIDQTQKKRRTYSPF